MDGNVESHIRSQTILHWFCETEKIIFKFLNNTEKLGTIAPSGKSFKSYFAWWSQWVKHQIAILIMKKKTTVIE